MALDKLDLLVLKALALAPLHGYGIGQRIAQLSGGDIRVTLGALYPALQRLERPGLVTAEVVGVGEQPAGAVLHLDSRRTAPTGQRPEGLGSATSRPCCACCRRE